MCTKYFVQYFVTHYVLYHVISKIYVELSVNRPIWEAPWQQGLFFLVYCPNSHIVLDTQHILITCVFKGWKAGINRWCKDEWVNLAFFGKLSLDSVPAEHSSSGTFDVIHNKQWWFHWLLGNQKSHSNDPFNIRTVWSYKTLIVFGLDWLV